MSPGRPPKATEGARLHHILQVAGAEFVRVGFADASVSRIASDAGVSKKTIYARFATKDELLVAVVDQLAEESLRRVTTAMTDASGDPEHVLTAFATQAATSYLDPEAVGLYRLIVSESPRAPQLGDIYRHMMDRFRVTLADYLSEQDSLGSLEIDDAEAAARQFGMLSYGEIRERALLGQAPSADDVALIATTAVHVFVRGYSPR